MAIQEILLQILTITGYPEANRVSFCNELLTMTGETAMLQYIKDFPEEKKQEIGATLEEKSYEEISPYFETFLQDEVFKTHFNKEFEITVSDYLKQVAPDLTEEQKKALDEFFASLQ
jgi:hypothetical protein